ncbi:hypothetical protein BLNAU_2702 [Blattamonas nauphoetae]|uniref:Lebercilin domain-containing protein n=1 Tax=Blattamonas nauphoetae TaxID=2049346 RepID=A0ABQ9YFA8_9EUKA|nr:hypothetical protein BLNAU_2702 [Blattamonas nauphoetae]
MATFHHTPLRSLSHNEDDKSSIDEIQALRLHEASVELLQNQRLTTDIQQMKARLIRMRRLLLREDDIKEKCSDLDDQIRFLQVSVNGRETELKILNKQHYQLSIKKKDNLSNKKLESDLAFLSKRLEQLDDQEDQASEALRGSIEREEATSALLEQMEVNIRHLRNALAELSPAESEQTAPPPPEQEPEKETESLEKLEKKKEKLEHKFQKMVDTKDKQTHQIQTRIVRLRKDEQEWQAVRDKLISVEAAKEREIRNLTLQLDGLKQKTTRYNSFKNYTRSHSTTAFYSNTPKSPANYIIRSSSAVPMHLNALPSPASRLAHFEQPNVVDSDAEQTPDKGDEKDSINRDEEEWSPIFTASNDAHPAENDSVQDNSRQLANETPPGSIKPTVANAEEDSNDVGEKEKEASEGSLVKTAEMPSPTLS